MAGLVSYESSDEDEVIEAPKEQVTYCTPGAQSLSNLRITLTEFSETEWTRG